MHCHLLIHDLFLPIAPEFPSPYQDLPLPALETLLGRGQRRSVTASPADGWLCQQFGIQRQRDWPVAPLTLVADGGAPGDAYWLRADPVHLQVARDQVVLMGPPAFALRPAEAQALVESLNRHFATDGLEFIAVQPDRWYVRMAQPAALHTTPLAAVSGHHIDSFLPGGPDAMRWHAWLNEMQMLLYTHPVNEAREAAGVLPVNSVWPWGGGTLPVTHLPPFQQVWADDLLTRGLAQMAGTPLAAAPASASQWLAETASPGPHLVVLDALREAALAGDLYTWREALQQMEADWFAPLLAALRQRKLQHLSLHAAGADAVYTCQVTAGDLWKFWRRPRPAGTYATHAPA